MADAPTQVRPDIPFMVASRVNERLSFQVSAALGAAQVTPPGSPVQLPAVGYLKSLRLEVTGAASGGTPTFNGDAPFNVIANISLKNSAGQQIIANIDGYALYLINKYGCVPSGLASGSGVSNDPKYSRQYSAIAASGFHFFLDVPLEFDASQGLGSVPAMASNRSYILEISFAPISGTSGVWTATTPPTAVTVTVDASAIYWDVPGATTPGGKTQATEPFGVNLAADFTTTAIWQSEFPPVAPGAQLVRTNNVGNVIRSHIFIARTSAGVRTDTDWPAIFQLYVNNNPQLRFKKTEWQDLIARWYQYQSTAFDIALGLDTGVYVIPYSLLAGGTAGDPSNSRAQLLPTVDATLLQFQANDFGAGISRMQVLTQSIATPDNRVVFSK